MTSIQTSILNRFLCKFAGTISLYYSSFPVNSVKFDEVLQKLIMRLVWNLLEYFQKLFILTSIQTSILYRLSCKFAVNLHQRQVLRQLPCKFGKVWLSTSKVINEISVKFDWVFLKVINFDVNLDVNSQPFTM